MRQTAQRILSGLGLTGAELSIALVDDATIRGLNRDWRGLDRATDVLSFSQMEGESPTLGSRPAVLGDVVVSTDAVGRQAKRFGHSREAELERLLVHGILHLLGHDHVKGRAQATRMRGEERRLLRLLRSGPPARKRRRAR